MGALRASHHARIICAQSWFFMASDGTIKKKNKKRYRNAEIFEAFTKGVQTDDEVVATYLKPRSEGSRPSCLREGNLSRCPA